MLEKKKTGEGLEKYFGLIKDDKESVDTPPFNRIPERNLQSTKELDCS